ncbi:porin [Olivibacter sp. SDN3]|nr:porin [Olivibacter sp. SDN3]
MKSTRLIGYVCLVFFFLFTKKAFGQRERDEFATLKNFKGLQFKSADSTIYMNFRFRMQNRLGAYTTEGDGLAIREFDARVRRLRMRVDGYLYSPKFSYTIQLAFTRGDQDFDDTGVANIVRDAVVFYNFTPNFYVAFGLNKLPGNRQRVNSSGQLQFADRSIVNAAMNIDRDFGVKAYYKGLIGDAVYHVKGAITTGEGRVANNTDEGLAYTGRLEFLPFGDFKDDGDYSEGDLMREERPKLAVGGGYSRNVGTTRSGGQIGFYLYSPVTLGTYFTDAIFKYNGWAYQIEYLKRNVDHVFLYNEEGDMQYVFNGQGLNQQLSYLFKNNYEIAGRYSWLEPGRNIRSLQQETEVVELGLTKYLHAHRIKLQLNVNYHTKEGIYALEGASSRWGGVFQVELGI